MIWLLKQPSLNIMLVSFNPTNKNSVMANSFLSLLWLQTIHMTKLLNFYKIINISAFLQNKYRSLNRRRSLRWSTMKLDSHNYKIVYSLTQSHMVMEISILYYICLVWLVNGHKREENGSSYSKILIHSPLELYLLF